LKNSIICVGDRRRSQESTLLTICGAIHNDSSASFWAVRLNAAPPDFWPQA